MRLFVLGRSRQTGGMTSTSERVLMVARPSRNDVAIELSIIIPAYNEAYRLPVALDALRHRVNSSSTEIIVVDDGSTDETVTAARRAGDWAKHLVVIEHPRESGQRGRCANRCCRCSRRRDRVHRRRQRHRPECVRADDRCARPERGGRVWFTPRAGLKRDGRSGDPRSDGPGVQPRGPDRGWHVYS